MPRCPSLPNVRPGLVVLVGATLWAPFAVSLLDGQERGRPPVRRAKPPKFDAKRAAETFFDDVFTKLIGERPAPAAPEATVRAAPTVPGAAPAAADPSSPGKGWSRIISAATIEDEVKAIKQNADKSITSPSDFAGRGHKVIRREFSLLTMLFGIIAEYDAEVRFKRDAATARLLFGRTASNTKAGGNINVFNEARQRKADLEDLLSGSSLAAPTGQETADWSNTIHRSPLMQRLEIAQQTRLSPALANAGELAKAGSMVTHEAEMIAAIAQVLTQPGLDDADDETYAGHARTMKEAARELAEAAKNKNYDQARAAAGRIDKACSQCHEAYR